MENGRSLHAFPTMESEPQDRAFGVAVFTVVAARVGARSRSSVATRRAISFARSRAGRLDYSRDSSMRRRVDRRSSDTGADHRPNWTANDAQKLSSLNEARGCAQFSIGGPAAAVQQAIRLGSDVGGIAARLMEHSVLALPDLHGKSARVGVAHGHTAQVVSGPDGQD